MNGKLSLQACETLTKPDFYQKFADLFKKVAENDEIFKQYVVKAKEFYSGVGENKHMEKWSTSSFAAEHLATKVRRFQLIPVKENQKNMVSGGSNMKNMVRYRSLGTDMGINAHWGSTTSEKIELIKAHPARKKTILLQDRTNSFLKEIDEHVDVLFDNYIILLKTVKENFKPDNLVLMQVPPLPFSKQGNGQRVDQPIQC